MKHCTLFFPVAGTALLLSLNAWNASAQCDDMAACNYDPAGTDPCTYNTSSQDFSQGVLVGIPFGQYDLDSTASCAVQPLNDNFLSMVPNDAGLMAFVIDQAVLDYFAAAVASGSVTQEQADQTLALMTYSTFTFCGETMTSNLPGLGSFDSEWTGSYWLIGPVGYYIAPAAPLNPGCGDPEASNFDLCALVDNSLCTYPQMGCEDPLACNYEEGTVGFDDCVYFDTDNFTIGENDFIGLYEEDCESGYAGWNDMPVPLAQDSTGGPLYFVLFETVENILVQFGYQAMVDDILTVSMSVCGDTMNYNSIYGDYDFVFDGLGFQNTIYGGYIAPESSFPAGCPDPAACNFDPCSHPFTAECEYLFAGTLSGDTVLTVGEPATFTYEAGEGNTVEWFTACGSLEVDGASATLTPEVESDCEICVTESNDDGCLAENVCLSLSVGAVDAVSESLHAGQLMPNPATTTVNVDWTGKPATWVVLDEQGRTVKSFQVREGRQTVSVEDLAPGLYLAGPLQGTKSRFTVLR